MDNDQLVPVVSAMWTTVALLAGGYARTRNRSALVWFLLTVFLGPIAAFLLVVWPPAEPVPSPAEPIPSPTARGTVSPPVTGEDPPRP